MSIEDEPTSSPTMLYTLLDTAQFIPLLTGSVPPILHQPRLYTKTGLLNFLASSQFVNSSYWLLAIPVTPELAATCSRFDSDAYTVQQLDALNQVSVRREVRRIDDQTWDTGELVD